MRDIAELLKRAKGSPLLSSVQLGNLSAEDACLKAADEITRLREANKELAEALAGVIGGECPECNGWGEIAYFGEMVSCKCGGYYTHTPTDDNIIRARAILSKHKGELK